MTRTSATVGFLLALTAIIGGLFAQQWRSLSLARAQVQHTEDVIESSRILFTQMIDAETNQRGFIISRDSRFLEPFRQALESAPTTLAELRRKASDNASQVERLTTIERLWAERAQELQLNFDLARQDRADEARARIALGRGQNLTDALRAQIDGVISEEQRFLAARLENAASAESTTRWMMILALMLAGCGLILSLYSLQRDNRELAASIERERSAAASLERARAQLSDVFAKTQSELSDTSRLLAAAVSSAPIVVWRQDKKLVYRWFSGHAMGQPAEWWIGKSDHDILPERMKFIVLSNKVAALESGQPQTFEVAAPGPAGDEWYDVRIEPTFDTGGAVTGLTGVAIEVTDRKKREQNMRLMMREIAHRSKNILAVVQAMARQTAAATPDPQTFIDRFASRLEALGATHSLLTDEGWAGADIGDLIRSQLAHQIDGIGRQIFLDGPRFTLPADQSQSIGLALHELSTNATKYGALSTSAGRVDVNWTVSAPVNGKCDIVLTWRETGGPPVTAPKRKGFGHVVFERTVSRAVGGKVDIDYNPNGLSWRLTFQLADTTSSGGGLDL